MASKAPKTKDQDALRHLTIMAGIFCAVLIIVGIIAISLMFGNQNSSGSSHKSGALGGLLNGELMTDPDAVTKEDLEAAYQSREEMTLATQEMVDTSTLQYLSRGDFEGLDRFLAEQEKMFKNAQGDEAQAIEDWQAKFSMLRSDLAATINLTAENAQQSFSSFMNPAILAAAIAYSPISVKTEAFLDWSAIMLPAVPAASSTQVNLTLAELEGPYAQLEAINKNTAAKYISIVAYDMTLFGYRCRMIALCDEYGYYRPYTLQNIDGHLVDPMTKTKVREIENALDPHYKLDDVISVTPFDQETFDALKEAHPEWFDADGKYVGAPNMATPTESIPPEEHQADAS